MSIPATNLLSGFAGCLVALHLAACRSAVPNRDPVGEVFPAVVGESLDQQEMRLPEALAGKPAVVLVGFALVTDGDPVQHRGGIVHGE